MRRRLAILAALLSSATLAAETDFEDEAYEFDRWTVGAAATVTLPQGGSQLRRLGGGAVRFGYYLDEFWAVEGETDWLEDTAGLAADVLWHWWGYERLDPFFTLGARGWLGGCGQVGPKAGIGTFFHLTDNWSLRFDADATLGLDTRRSVDYTLSAGVQYSF